MSSPLEYRVLVLASAIRDSELERALTESGVEWELCPDVTGLCHALSEGAAAVVLTEGWAALPEQARLLAALESQPIWSELPVLVVGTDGAACLERCGRVTLLERPLRVSAFRFALQGALRSRRRQYQVRDQFAERRLAEQAFRVGEERLRLLTACIEPLCASSEPEDVAQTVFDRVGPHLGLDAYLWYRMEPDARQLRLASYAGIPEPVAEQLATLALGEGLCGSVAASRQPLVLSYGDSGNDPRSEWLRRFGMRAYVCQPLLSGQQLLGTLCFAARNREGFSEDEVAFLRTLSQYVALAQERVRAAESLRDAAKRKDEFLAMLAHELRNPLSPVAHAVEIMRARPGRVPGERARRVVERQLRHMSRLIDDLLDVSRINTGKITLKRERLDLVIAIERALETASGFVAKSGHTLEVELPDAPVIGYVDPVRLEQVITNLLHNAAKYTEPGGTIWVMLQADEEFARIRVRDSGIGIPPPLLHQVFDLFTQGERDLDRAQGGLGLGLTLVRNLTHLHGGTVEAFSDGPGHGSEFLVTLPLQPPELNPGLLQPTLNSASSGVERPETHLEPLGTPGPTSKRILVVDDNRDAAETLAELAELWGFEVDTAYDGLAALERAAEWEPGFVFLDIGMPGLDGYEVARQLRSDHRFAHMILIALTGYGQQEDFERSRAAGFDHHLVKPVDMALLEKLLREPASSSARAPLSS